MSKSLSGCIVILLGVLLGITRGSSISGSRHIPKENFLITDHLADGEFERRISYNGLIGKQTSISQTTKSLSLWQLTDGHLFLQFIYSGDDKIIDCEYIRQKHHIQDFISKFNRDVTMAQSHNFTNYPSNHHQYTMPEVTKHEFREFLDNDAIPPSYKMAFEDTEDFENLNEVTRQTERYGMRNFTFVELRQKQDIPEDLLPLLDIKSIKEQCNLRHQELQKIVGGLDSDDEDIRRNATEHLNRRKRALSDMFRMPNTKWCGTGNGAGVYNQLGGASKADMCCRKHDHCKLNIHAMTTKWQFFNYRFYTISSCSCDRRFRTCLKMADSPDANIVGKIFFNIVQSKCFILKPEKYCKQRSWWGECLKKGIRKRAHLRDNRKY
ncbi:uncharacterized protein LOC129804039 isoform X2 [Phlebotomus papatasi]|uniref:uncharacterized protein LOC129804039 isoform X2 n=1 Tax=Phlebotomus papatasi TaxID=29031 RepID=UPI00248331B7|nr:uncharacterized protein LOC129804039 isoform X2 [Phlebotomus papatasi]XP_055707001.1 uncharacterized protein LOC129804039 isoform X2 [Phlebotomus papatasi]XP_055707003.1 uncharacterized protein LOC129804039 isoform X2 [Phlebotomus papatasi]